MTENLRAFGGHISYFRLMKTVDRLEPLAVKWGETKEALADWIREGGFWRWLGRVLGVVCVGLWVIMIWWEDAGGSSALQAVGTGLFAFAFLIAGAVLLAPSLVIWASAPLFKLIDAVYLGSNAIERPPLNYDLAERLLRERRWHDAAAEFERIAYWHPQEERAWREAIRCAELAGDPEGASWLHRRSRLRCAALRRTGGR